MTTDEIARIYRRFADIEAGSSPQYQRICAGVADDDAILDLLAGLPRIKRQPNLLLAAVRHVAGLADGFADFRMRLFDNRAAVITTMMARRTQTNEAARCASLYPALASLPQPIALIEAGASAGLCLIPDRYRYEYAPAGITAGDPDSPLTIRCDVDGALPPMPRVRVAWRHGIDLNPLDVSNADDVAWLETLIWPEHEERLERLRRAIELARLDPPPITKGDFVETLPAIAAQAPPDATLVVQHSVALVYVPADVRQRFVETVHEVGAHWLAHEAPGAFPQLDDGSLRHRPPRGVDPMLVALDGKALALAQPHGGWLGWN